MNHFLDLAHRIYSDRMSSILCTLDMSQMDLLMAVFLESMVELLVTSLSELLIVRLAMSSSSEILIILLKPPIFF